MKIDIMMQQSRSDNKIFRKVAQRARLSLNRFATSIQTVTIRITDTNGPKGGEDTRCIVSVKLASANEVVVQGEGEKVFSVLRHCLCRVERAVCRNLDRRRDTPIRMNRRRTKAENEPLWLENEHYEFSL